MSREPELFRGSADLIRQLFVRFAGPAETAQVEAPSTEEVAPPAETEPDEDLELDEDFLRRIREV